MFHNKVVCVLCVGDTLEVSCIAIACPNTCRGSVTPPIPHPLHLQVSRILGPIVSCLEQLAVLNEKDDYIKNLIDTGYGGLEKLKKDILFDFFRSAFDGSGADNFFDAGRYETGAFHG